MFLDKEIIDSIDNQIKILIESKHHNIIPIAMMLRYKMDYLKKNNWTKT